MNNKNLNIILIALLVILTGFIVYQNFIADDGHVHETAENMNGEQFWTCGMHPDIVTNEPGNCPICGMKLTPIKNDINSSSGKKKILYWVAPMDPNEIYNEPGKSKMGMDLVPVYADQGAQSGVVTIDPVVQQNMNVKFTTIERRSLSPSIETNATITTDERNEEQITARVGGWIEKLYVNYTGQMVKRGDKLLEIYSPELVSAQQEYLTALRYKEKVNGNSNNNLSSSGDELLKNSYRKLQLLNMSDSEIEALQKSNDVKTSIPLYSPVTGTVMMKSVIEGEKINAGQNLLHIADLSSLWIKADLYESDIKNVKVGNPVTVKVNAYPSQTFQGKVSFIYPTIDLKTRTVQVRIDIANTDYKLKPAMLANVTIQSGESSTMVVIPETAVIRSGQQNVAVQFLGNGKFKPAKVELGNYADGFYQILSGLKAGDKVVTSAQFLIDSESSLKTAMKNFSNSDINQESSVQIKSDDTKNTAEQMSQENHDHAKIENEYGVESPLIRTGVIDIKSIDKNGDGKLWECPMDWNIIGDEYQRCPVCEMKMIEYSIDDVKANLEKHGYEYK